MNDTNISPLDQILDICNECLSAISLPKKFTPYKQRHWVEIVFLYIISQMKVNFTQMGRYGKHCEQTYRNFMNKHIGWFIRVNIYIATMLFKKKHRRAIAIDPSYIPKAGKKTPGLGLYWSGCAGQTKRGLEILGVAAIDVDEHQSIALECIQTPSKKERVKKGCSTGEDWCLYALMKHKKQLKQYCNIIVADAQFSTCKFANRLEAEGFHLVSRLRCNASLRYQYLGPRREGRGRPKQYDGEVDFKSLDLSKVTPIEVEEGKAYTFVANVKAMKRFVRIVVWYNTDDSYKIFFSTDLDMPAKDIIDTYRSRFQIEFAFRDAKQFTGLTDCQSRNKNALQNAFNFSLTAINVAKLQMHRNGWTYSISRYKLLMTSLFLVQRFSSRCAPEHYSKIIQDVYNEFTWIAA